jgi:hypothetical protein
MLPTQVVFISDGAFATYMQTRHLPRDGAFVTVSDIPLSLSLADLKFHLASMLVPLEAYRAGVRRVKQREGQLSDVYAELLDGADTTTTPRLTQLVGLDTIVQGSELRLRPTEQVSSSRQHDQGWVAELPPNVVEFVAASCATSRDVHNLRQASATVRAQYVPRQILRLLVVVHGWN